MEFNGVWWSLMEFDAARTKAKRRDVNTNKVKKTK